MAAPTVSGVAALLLAYYPELKAKEVRSILKSSVYIPEVDVVNRPGGDKTTRFDELSGTGGLVNAFQAVQMAETMQK